MQIIQTEAFQSLTQTLVNSKNLTKFHLITSLTQSLGWGGGVCSTEFIWGGSAKPSPLPF